MGETAFHSLAPPSSPICSSTQSTCQRVGLLLYRPISLHGHHNNLQQSKQGCHCTQPGMVTRGPGTAIPSAGAVPQPQRAPAAPKGGCGSTAGSLQQQSQFKRFLPHPVSPSQTVTSPASLTGGAASSLAQHRQQFGLDAPLLTFI